MPGRFYHHLSTYNTIARHLSHLIYINPTLFRSPTLLIMEIQPIPSSPVTAHLCDVILGRLRPFGSVADMEAFAEEIRTLRKFLDLMNRVFKARLPRMAFEEQHFNCVEVLLERCRTTLSRLSQILAVSRPAIRQAASKGEPLQDLDFSEIMVLRARISFYTQTLQMSLQTVKL